MSLDHVPFTRIRGGAIDSKMNTSDTPLSLLRLRNTFFPAESNERNDEWTLVFQFRCFCLTRTDTEENMQ